MNIALRYMGTKEATTNTIAKILYYGCSWILRVRKLMKCVLGLKDEDYTVDRSYQW